MSKYQTIIDSIHEKIFSGEYKVGMQLPSQEELANEYQTSRMTIQKALNILRREDVVFTEKGVGTFVKSKVLGQTNAKEYIGLTNRFKNKQKVTSQVISFQLRPAVEEEIEKLELKEDDFVYDIIRARFVNDEPYSMEYTIMPRKLIPEITEDILHHSIYQYIQNDLNLRIGTATRRIRADKSDQYDQRYMGIDKHDPVLEVEQVICLSDGRPFEFSQVRYPYLVGELTYTAPK